VRVDSRKTRGLFSKRTRLNQYLPIRIVGSRSGGSGVWLGQQALGAAAWSPEFGPRGGTSPALADLGRPGSILDETWSGRKLAACTTHLGGWHESTAAEIARSAVEAGRCGGGHW
jgi:hypothetical protein